ncbi:O-methyltransferase [Pseudalkalibacillus salsuginis]|uniref:O-methyltransferase n=1 Tax=Pseudalkalibacillus salsuginis TaxID=2910972 RepID=UPI001F33D855|nr:O-methyltransferase [Pseudalkalibacillus salsuginis]MCF6409284.1 O-methyltransferase [Pseudalkalibacillus salsuginis]
MMNLESYIQSLFVQKDEELEKITDSLLQAGMPTISVSPESGKLLTLLVKISGAQNLLEIGALGGYSGICLLRGDDIANLTSLELHETYADMAKQHVEEAGFKDRVRYKIGPALDSLKQLKRDRITYDFFFIDADKGNYVNYLDYCIQLASPGALIIADNTLWGGEVLNEHTENKDTKALQTYNRKVADHPQLESLLVPLGDGLTIARLKSK